MTTKQQLLDAVLAAKPDDMVPSGLTLKVQVDSWNFGREWGIGLRLFAGQRFLIGRAFDVTDIVKDPAAIQRWTLRMMDFILLELPANHTKL